MRRSGGARRGGHETLRDRQGEGGTIKTLGRRHDCNTVKKAQLRQSTARGKKQKRTARVRKEWQGGAPSGKRIGNKKNTNRKEREAEKKKDGKDLLKLGRRKEGARGGRHVTKKCGAEKNRKRTFNSWWRKRYFRGHSLIEGRSHRGTLMYKVRKKIRGKTFYIGKGGEE